MKMRFSLFIISLFLTNLQFQLFNEAKFQSLNVQILLNEFL